jgi:hypothetical protein
MSDSNILLECPTQIYNLDQLNNTLPLFEKDIRLNGLLSFLENKFIDFDELRRAAYGKSRSLDTYMAQWGKNYEEKLPIIYRIFIDRIEFDLEALKVYLNLVSQEGQEISAVVEALAENNEIPRTIYFEEIKDIKLLTQETQVGWITRTYTGANCYEIIFKDDRKIKIPLEIGNRLIFWFVSSGDIPKLHLWWKELARGRIPEDLNLHLKFRTRLARKHEELLEFDEAANVYKKLGMENDAIRVRKLKAEKDAVKVKQTIVQGDQVTKTEIKDSVVSKSNIGSGGDDKVAKLEKIANLKKEGLIDDDEFKQMKKEILGK